MTADPNHTANQYRVARLLVPVLIEANCDDQDVMTLDNSDWVTAVNLVRARQANPQHPEFIASPSHRWSPKPGYVPSESTKRLVAAMIKAETAPTPTTDPFEGLPS